MTTAANLHDRPQRAGSANAGAGWLVAGRVTSVAGVVLCVVLQAINHDFFPPQISVSQYGLGPRGWVFTLWAVVIAFAPLALHAGGTVHGQDHGSAFWLAAGALGLIAMGVVRTDAGGLQHSWHAKVHMFGSILALVAVPIGIALAMGHARAWWRRAGWSLMTGIAISLIMVLISAAGLATPGFSAPASWALWQAVAVTLDMIMLTAYMLSSFPSQQVGLAAAAADGRRR